MKKYRGMSGLGIGKMAKELLKTGGGEIHIIVKRLKDFKKVR